MSYSVVSLSCLASWAEIKFCKSKKDKSETTQLRKLPLTFSIEWAIQSALKIKTIKRFLGIY